MKSFFLPALALLALSVSAARAQTTNVDLLFNAPVPGTALDTGFQGVYNPDPTTAAILPGGGLQITTVPGDIYGDYEHAVNSAKNVFYTEMLGDPNGQTIAESRVTVNNLLQDYQGGGVWMGTDENHYIRLGVIHNGSNLMVESIRENANLWGNVGGPGGDIVGRADAVGTPPGPLDVSLRLIRNDGHANAYYSLDGVNYTPLAGGFTFNDIITGPGQGTNPGAVPTEGTFKVGVYGFGGGGNPGLVTFRCFSASSTGTPVIPEPGSFALLLAGLPGLLAIRRKRA